MKECDSVNRNLRDICECTRAGMTLNQCNQRRLLWGLKPLESLGVSPYADEPEQNPLTTAERIASFVSITAQTVWRMVRLQPGLLTDEQMQPRIDICAKCPHLVASHCELCGCKCQRENVSKFMNKLAHRDSVCPASPPRWGKFVDDPEVSSP